MALVNVPCEITGSVWKVLVSEGDRVSEDDTLMILESMKMEIPVLAPEDGTVHEIKVQEGQTILEGNVAIVIEV